MVTGKVYLLGAGPGDPELITLRAMRALESADVVLYDALIHADQLSRCKKNAELIFVGKRAGRASARQAAINEQMLQHATAGKVVARIKGGDPYLFGRGSEEAEFLAAHGIPFEVVPGVPSPMAAAAYAGLSLTHRDLASSVAYITATECDEKDSTSHDWGKLATATQTLVIFMGVRRLREHMDLLMRHGRAAGTPVAVVQWASMPEQRVVVGVVGDIADRVEAAGIGMPALTIVGDVVRLHEQLRWFDKRPLFGKRVLVTRAREQASALSARLRDAGAAPVEAALIRIVPPADPAPMLDAAKRLSSYDYVVLTSQNAVDRLFAAIDAAGLDARAFGDSTVCALGPKTADALAARGVKADLTPDAYRGEGMAAALLESIDDPTRVRVLIPCARIARDVIPNALRTAGAVVDVVVAYDTVGPAADEQERIQKLVRERAIDAVAFTSASTVENLVTVLGGDAVPLLGGMVKASIGPVTTEAALAFGIEIDVTAAEPSTESLVEALVRYYGDDVSR
jgi:uroporphyrinogen III methyltransferase/synthase